MTDRDPYRFFRVEAAELSDQLSRGVLALVDGEKDVVVAELLRAAHTLKGAARVVKHRAMAEAAHALEELLGPVRASTMPPTPEASDALLAASDRIAALVRELSPAPPNDTAAVPKAPRAPSEPPEADPRPAAVDTEELEHFVLGIGEANVQLRNVKAKTAEFDRMRHLAALLVNHLDRAMPEEAGRGGLLAKARSIASELEHLAEAVERTVTSGLEQTERELSEVRGSAERLQLVPCRAIEEALVRTTHDVARELGKRVTFGMKGGDVRLDAHAVARLRSALVQVVRNAVAHGIELPDDRARLRKPASGRVELLVSRRGNQVVFTCSDDGRGVDLDALRRVAEQRGALAPGARIDRAALLELLFQGGLSTARTVTETSGRGIGLDIVRDSVARLGGSISLDTGEGVGTTLELAIPMVLSSMDALLVKAGAAVAAIPLSSVVQTLRLTADDVVNRDGRATVFREGSALPVVPLSRLLRDGSDETRARAFSAVVVRAATGVAAFTVDRLLGTSSVVVRGLPPLAAIDPVVLGATLDVSGRPELVLEPDVLVARAVAHDEHLDARAAETRLPVLVVDDSLTTRMLERSILESAGYEVELAASAEEALEKTAQRRYGLFLVDVEMPGMSGFDFVKKTRPQAVPAILVSSRSSPEDLDRGREVGASAYVVKAEFDQRVLLDTIRGLVTA